MNIGNKKNCYVTLYCYTFVMIDYMFILCLELLKKLNRFCNSILALLVLEFDKLQANDSYNVVTLYLTKTLRQYELKIKITQNKQAWHY